MNTPDKSSPQEYIHGPKEPTTPLHSDDSTTDGLASPKEPTIPPITTPSETITTSSLEAVDQNPLPPTHTTPDDKNIDHINNSENIPTINPDSEHIPQLSTELQIPLSTTIHSNETITPKEQT